MPTRLKRIYGLEDLQLRAVVVDDSRFWK